MKQSRAVIAQRREQILRRILREGEVPVADFCKQFNVSEITVRRDLQEMENLGLLQRLHGGARARLHSQEVMYFDDKRTVRQREKNAIAAALARLIEPGSTLFCNAGTTTLALMSRLKDSKMRIITNNAMSISVLGGGVCELICTGGEYQERTRSFCGDLATQIIGKVHADICVLGANGISVSGGLTTTVYTEIQLNEMMARRCHGRTIVAADGAKVGKTSCFTCLPLSQVDVLITDASASGEEIARIREAGVEVLVVEAE